jgi:hypothetical protein
MNQTEWFGCDDPERLLQFIRGRATDRKLRLLCLACCRRIDRLLDARSRDLLGVLEQQLDGSASSASHFAPDLHHDQVGQANPYSAQHIAANTVNAAMAGAAWAAAWNVVGEARRAIGSSGGNTYEEAKAQAALAREILGSPFHPVRLDPAWLTPQVMAFTRHIYDDRAFDLLPALGTALSDAGCTDEEVLRHCAGAGPHVCGCWLVDLLLNRV